MTKRLPNTDHKFRLVVFDLDGTLLDSLADLADSMNAALEKMGFPEHPARAYRQFIGEGVEVLAKRALPAGKADAETIAKCLATYRAEYKKRWMRTRPYPGIMALLRALERRGVGAAVISNKPHEFTRLMVRRLLAGAKFAAVRGANQDYPRKPHPAGTLAVAARAGVAPGQCLYLGDSGTDMRTAKAAGMYPVGALWGFRDAAELRAAGAKVLVKRPAEMLAILTGKGR
jgi:phosphoglycolate phosphatase